MKENIFTFWYGEMPEYLKLCLKTWNFDYIMLDKDNIKQYSDIDIERLFNIYSLPQIADYIRVHVLRDNGGYWFDTDVIDINGNIISELKNYNILGKLDTRENSIGFLHTEKNSDMFIKWAEYQDHIIDTNPKDKKWSILGNDFTDSYIKSHNDIKIYPLDKCWIECNIIQDNIKRSNKYRKFYFEKDYYLSDLDEISFLSLHNSWTPKYYKNLSKEEILRMKCTMSNILNEVLEKRNSEE